MSEPTPDVLHVEPAYEPWDVAVDAVCTDLEWYAVWRDGGCDPAGAARTALISDQTAERFERALTALRPDTSGGTDG